MHEFLLSTTVEDWKDHTNLGHHLSQKQKLLVQRSIIAGQPVPVQYSLQLRTYSEMPICHALETMIPPNGFEIINGLVKVYQQESGDNTSLEDHVFFYNPELDTVICITPGQFADDMVLQSGFEEPGDRIQLLKSLLENQPNATIISPSGSTSVLHGTRSAIKDSLGLEYIVYEDELS